MPPATTSLDEDQSSSILPICASDMTLLQLERLRIQLVRDVPLSCLFPERFIPADDDHELLENVRLLLLDETFGASRNENPFNNFFHYRRRVVVDFHGLFEDHIRGTAHRMDPDPINSCPTYDRLCVQQFASGIIYNNLCEPPIPATPIAAPAPSPPRVPLRVMFPTKHRWYTGGGASRAVKWKADSGGHLSFFNYKLLTPVVSFHASQHYLAPGASHVAHETGIHLSHLHKNLKHLIASRRDSKALEDQETFVLAVHGRFMHLSVGKFTKEYSAWARKAGLPESTADGDPVASVSFTNEFDLDKADDLKEAARTVLVLYRYIDSGEARIGVVQSGGFEFQRSSKSGCPTTI